LHPKPTNHEHDGCDERYLEHFVVPEGTDYKGSNDDGDDPQKRIVFLFSTHRCPTPQRSPATSAYSLSLSAALAT
jgi:hypothetical protein